MTSQSTQSKTWLYAVGAGVALVGGALIFHLISKQEQGNDLIAEVEKIGTP
jgi:hypothetical protein